MDEVAILETLHPTDKTSLADVRSLFSLQNYRAALPSALTEPLLISLTRDLRVIERVMKGDSAAEPEAAAAVYLVLQFMMRPQKGRSGLEQLGLSEFAMASALTVLQVALEREIVSRAVGVRADQEDESFLAALDSCI